MNTRLHNIYDLLVRIGGAHEHWRGGFIQLHEEDPPCREWRFSGHLGFGGKYRSKTNTVDCYSEDKTPARLAIIKELNAELAKLK